MSKLWRRFVFVLRRRRFERELEEEMHLHLEMKARADGGTEEAHYRARRQFGNNLLLREQSRELWGWRWLEDLAQDLRYALRVLRRNPGFATVALLTLALGIGANTAIFSVLNAVLIRELPVRQPEDLLRVAPIGERGEDMAFSYPFFRALRKSQQVFSSVYAATGSSPMDLTTATGTQKANVVMASGEYFSTLGVVPRLGRAFTGDDNQIGKAHPVAVISDGFWQRQFGRNPSILGRTIIISRQALTVIGVTPPEFFGDTVGVAPDVWAPIALEPQLTPGRNWLEVDYVTFLHVLGRLRPGLTERQARAGLAVQLKQIQNAAPASEFHNVVRLDTEPASRGLSELRQRFSQPLRLLMGIAALVLLLACANIANLLLARAAARQKEIAVRLATGAPRRRILRQLITESLVLAGTGGLCGVLVGFWGSTVLVALVSSPGSPVVLDVGPDAHVLGFAVAASVVTGLLFGVGPAMRATRIDPMPALKGASGTARGDLRIGKALVAVQVAACLLLLVGAGLLVQTLHNLRTFDAGFAREGILQVEFDPVAAGYQAGQFVPLYRRISEQVDGLPGVRSSSFAFIGLVEGDAAGFCCLVAEGHEPKPKEDARVRFNIVMPRYFASTGMVLLAGRDFTASDFSSSGHPKSVILNETMAQNYFGQENPVGKHISKADANKLDYSMEVIGVVKDAKYEHLREVKTSVMYLLPVVGFFDGGVRHLYVRTAGDPSLVAAAVMREVKSVDPRLAIIGAATVRELIDRDVTQERLVTKLTGAFAGLALLLAAIGLYGVISYAVARRTAEIGIRMALGAQRVEVLWMVLREVLLVTLMGIGLGLPAVFAGTRVISSLLFGLTPADPTTIAISMFLMFSVAALAGYVPARRAARTDPMEALRYE